MPHRTGVTIAIGKLPERLPAGNELKARSLTSQTQTNGANAMGIEQATTEKGRQSARGLRKSAAKEEKKVEARTWQKGQIVLRSVRKAPMARARETSRASERVGSCAKKTPPHGGGYIARESANGPLRTRRRSNLAIQHLTIQTGPRQIPRPR